MLTLISPSPLPTLYQFIPAVISPTHVQFDKTMTSRHGCPCCSSILLRHVSRSQVYWHCTHCHARMSVWQRFE